MDNNSSMVISVLRLNTVNKLMLPKNLFVENHKRSVSPNLLIQNLQSLNRCPLSFKGHCLQFADNSENNDKQ